MCLRPRPAPGAAYAPEPPRRVPEFSQNCAIGYCPGFRDEASDIDGVLYQGFKGLAGFRDRSDMPFIREAALWGLKYRFKQLDDAAIEAFAEMPDKENLGIIAAIWHGYSSKPFVGNELHHSDIIRTLSTHRFPETIPLMARFVNSGFMQEAARQFLVEMTGIDFGGDERRWLDWYESRKREFGDRN